MIELRYNKDGELEYRTTKLVRGETAWNEWIVVLSEEQSSVEKSEWDQIRESCDRVSREEGILILSEEITSLNKEIDRITGELDATKAREAIVRDRMRFWFEQYELREEALKKQDARVAELETEKKTLLESELWGVNCKPSPSNADPGEAERIAESLLQRAGFNETLNQLEAMFLDPGQTVVWEEFGANEDGSAEKASEAAPAASGAADPSVGSELAARLRRFNDRVEAGEIEPQPVKKWLTKDERMAIRWVTDIKPIGEEESRKHFTALRKLLTREKPPEVVRPAMWVRFEVEEGR